MIDQWTGLALDAFATFTYTGHSETTMHHKNGRVMILNEANDAHWIAATLMRDGLHRQA